MKGSGEVSVKTYSSVEGFSHFFIAFIQYYRKPEKNQDNEIYLNTTTEINYYKYKSTKIYLYVLRQSYSLVKFHSMIHSARWYFEVAYKSSLQLIVSVIMGSSFDQALIFRLGIVKFIKIIEWFFEKCENCR